jgi:hypothetical protein
VHWGGIAYPDQYSTFTSGLTLNRFTPTDGLGSVFDSTVTQTIGLNLISLSWTRHWDEVFQDFSTNLTVGIGPTADQPSRFFQNEVIHSLRHIPKVPVRAVREDTDATIDGSVTQWLELIGKPKTFFGGGGFSVGTLYQELFVRTGLRRMQVLPDWERSPIGSLGVRASVMARYSRLFDGALLHAVKPSSTIWQTSLAVGSYPHGTNIPEWEVEFAVGWDSGIFVNGVGQSRKEFFWSGAISYGPVRFETWNDSLDDISRTDFGPTYGASLTIDIFRLSERVYAWPFTAR